MSDLRPTDCRFRLQDEGKPYPRSSCSACGRTITTGLGRECSRPSDRIAQLERELADTRERSAGWAKSFAQKCVEAVALETENSRLQSEYASLLETVTRKVNEKIEAERDLAEARAELDRLTQEREDWKNKAAVMDVRRHDQLERANAAEAERDRLAAELAEERAKPKLKIKRVERQPLVIDEPAWPNGCHSLSSCSRHLACMYYGCRHEGRNVKPEIEGAIAARASLQNGEKAE